MSRTTRAHRQARPARAGLYVLLLVALLTFLIPLYWLASSALKPTADIYRFPPSWIPRTLHLANFATAWNAVPFGHFFVNSLIVSLAGTALTVINASLSSYALTFIRVPFSNLVFYIILGALMIPGDIALIPNYVTISNLGWLNTYQGIFLPASGSAFGTFLMRQHLRTIPLEVVEAARVAGAGHASLLLRIVLPMSKPILITTAVVSLVTEWNQFIWPLIVTNTSQMRTLPIGLLFLNTQEGYQDWGSVMAGTVMVALPMVVAFVIAQRQIVEGLTGTTPTRSPMGPVRAR